MKQRHVQSGGEYQIVVLFPQRGIADVNIAKRILPSEPFVDLRHRSKIEACAVFAGVTQIGIKIEALSQARSAVQLVSKFFSQRRRRKASAECRVAFMRVVKST